MRGSQVAQRWRAVEVAESRSGGPPLLIVGCSGSTTAAMQATMAPPVTRENAPWRLRSFAAGGLNYDPQLIKPPAGYKGSDDIQTDAVKEGDVTITSSA